MEPPISRNQRASNDINKPSVPFSSDLRDSGISIQLDVPNEKNGFETARNKKRKS